MCGGFECKYTDRETGEIVIKKVYYPIPQLKIPVLIGDGVIELIQWGKRKGEDEHCNVPQTGWARLDSIEKGKWHWLKPIEVKVPALRYMEKDIDKISHWFEMEEGTYLRALRVDTSEKSFVYIVTDEPKDPELAKIHNRQPVIVT